MRKSDPSTDLGADQAAAADLGMKGMIPIGRPFLDYVLSALADAGYERVCLVIGPEHDAVVRHYTIDSPPARISVEFAVQQEPLGTADAVLAAEAFCGDDSFIVINSDNYYPAEALRALREAYAPAIAGFARSALITAGNLAPERIGRFGALVIDSDGLLVRIVPRPGDPATEDGEVYASMNCWLFDTRIFDACRHVPISPRGEFELPRAVQMAVDAGDMKVRVIKLSLPVLDMSTRADVASVQEKLSGVFVRL